MSVSCKIYIKTEYFFYSTFKVIIFDSNHNTYLCLQTFWNVFCFFVFLDGIRRSRKLFPIDGTKPTSKTHKIEKRNARERYRVKAVNNAFCRLRCLIPAIAARRKRVSKVKTLKKAVQYIMELQTILQSYA